MKRQILNRISGGLSPLLLAFWLPLTGQAQPGWLWTAYNDHYAGPNTGTFATAWNVFGTVNGAPGNSGLLINSVTGAALPVTLTINSAGSIGQGTTSGAPGAETPAGQLFAGYIDWGNGGNPHAPLINPGAEVNYVFSGLDPQKRYSFAGTGVRGGSGDSYALRWTLLELLGAQDCTPAHTTGAAAYTNGLPSTQVAINTGQNSTTGDYAEWKNIQPSADGTFTLRISQYTGPIPTGTAGGPYGYGLMAIRLQEFNTTPSPAAIVVQPTNQTVIELAPVVFHAVASGNPPPAYQWYRNGAPIPEATNEFYALEAAVISDNQAGFYVVASNWVANVSCLTTSSVARLTVLPDDTAPVVLTLLPPANATLSSLRTVEVFFNKPVLGVDPSDLLINDVPATRLNLITPSQYLFEFSQPPAGTVQAAWRADHGIHDFTVSSNGFAGGSWTYRLDTNSLYAIRINEFLASNKHFNRDEDGDYSDWIELQNSGTVTVPLAGCYLTDDSHDLVKWQFPPVSLTPNSYLLIWASGKNRTNSTAPLHTNFELNKGGGYLALVMSDGTHVISAFAPEYPAQYTDVSYGSDRTDPSWLGFFTTPTPKAPNSTTGTGFGPEVRFSRESGTFTTSFTLRLTTTTTNAAIRYTLGTNMPTASSTRYTGPIAISNTVQVRARTFVTGWLPGEVQSRDYIRLDTANTNITRFNSPLPIVVFHNYGKGDVPYSDPGQFVMIQVFEPKNGRSSLTNAPDLAVMGTIHRRGQATRWLPKASLRVETIDEYEGNQNVPLLGWPADDDWVFYGINGYDKVLMHNPLAHELYRQLGRYSSRTRFVEVYLKDNSGTPGPLTYADYHGLYVVEEKIKIADHRLDLEELQPENTNAPSVTGGYLFSIDKDGPAPGFYAANSSMWYLDPDGPTISTPQRAPQLQYINNYLNTFYSALTGSKWTNPLTGYAAYIDVPGFIDYHLHQVLVFNADMLRISSYYCKPRNEKMTPAALWDFDRAFAMYSADGDQRGFNPWRWRSGAADGGTDPFNAGNTFHNPWYGRLFTDPDFWQQWIDRYQELRKSVYSYSNVTAMIQRFGNEVAEATPREYTRWRGSGSSDTSPNQGVTTGDGWTYTFPTPGTWPSQVQFVKVWFTNRMIFMDTNFLAPPTLSRAGGPVTYGTTVTLIPASKIGSSVLYTLDGRDPRLPGGAILPTALSNTGPVTLTLTNNVKLFARSRNPNHRNLTGANNPPISSPWSGVTVEPFYLAIPDLRITELMYHPGQPPAGNTNDTDSFEYIELTNTGTNTISLVGFQLTDGIRFTFTATNRVTSLAPGERVLVVKNLAAFASQYPTRIDRVAGEFSGQLDNAGERLVLVGPLGEPIHDFTYDTRWYPATDGWGFSLVVAEEQAPLNSWTNPTQWRSSAFDGGSPAASDPAPIAVQPILVNELLTHADFPEDDAIELWNPNPTPVDIGYWYLTDNENVPKKYLIPPGVTIPGYGFAVFYRTNSFGVAGLVNALGLINEPFGFNADGEEVYLFSGHSSGQLTGYIQGFEFGAAATGVALGRHVNSVGQVMEVAQSRNTLGAANAYPQVGPLVISEIMYHPPDLVIDGRPTGNKTDEYLELHNLTSGDLPLYETQHPANTWRLRGGVDFEFPCGLVVPPGGYLVLLSFGPEADPASLAAFKTRYGLSNQVSFLGPYTGQLGNSGDRLELLRPGDPDPNTQVVPLILVDCVEYDVTSPWPATASGTGASLQRIEESAFGNDPAHWIAGPPLPGQGLPAANLTLELHSSDLLISWPDSPVTWKLEETTSLEATPVWLPATVSPVRENGHWQVLAPWSALTNRYFRLKYP